MTVETATASVSIAWCGTATIGSAGTGCSNWKFWMDINRDTMVHVTVTIVALRTVIIAVIMMTCITASGLVKMVLQMLGVTTAN